VLQSRRMFEFLRRTGPYYWFAWRVVRIHFTIWHQLKVIGVENVPLSGGALLAANHISHLDPPSIGVSLVRRTRFVAKQELFEQFFLKWFLPSLEVIPIKRGSGGSAMLETAIKAVEKGDLVTFFPEGTRSRTGYPGRPRTGIVVVAASTGVPVIPARVSGTFDCMPPGSRFPRPGPIQVAFGKPIVWKKGEIDLNNREQMQQAAQYIMDRIMELPGWFPKRAPKRLPVPAEELASEDEQLERLSSERK